MNEENLFSIEDGMVVSIVRVYVRQHLHHRAKHLVALFLPIHCSVCVLVGDVAVPLAEIPL